MAKVDVTPRVRDFVARATHRTFERENAPITSDSAVWYLEAGINYSTAKIWAEYSETSTDTLILPIDLSSATIPEGTLLDAYAQLKQAVTALVNDTRTLLYVDVVETQEVLNGRHILVICQFGSAADRSYNNPPDASYPPGYSCSWNSSYQPGMPCSHLSAEVVIRTKINAANIFDYIPGQYAYSVETWEASFLPTNISDKKIYWKDSFVASNTPNNNGVHETLFFSARMNNPSTFPCLDATEMAYWTGNATTNGTWLGITKIRQEYCPSKIFFDCLLVGALLPSPGNPSVTYGMHAAQIRYGLLGYELTPGGLQ